MLWRRMYISMVLLGVAFSSRDTRHAESSATHVTISSIAALSNDAQDAVRAASGAASGSTQRSDLRELQLQANGFVNNESATELTLVGEHEQNELDRANISQRQTSGLSSMDNESHIHRIRSPHALENLKNDHPDYDELNEEDAAAVEINSQNDKGTAEVIVLLVVGLSMILLQLCVMFPGMFPCYRGGAKGSCAATAQDEDVPGGIHFKVPKFYYVTYWSSDSTDNVRGPWNPAVLGASDGVQLALVQDGQVIRTPTEGTCMHGASSAHGSKEWHDLPEPVYIVNFGLSEMPTLEQSSQLLDKHGSRRVEVGHPGWGGSCLTVKEVWEMFYELKTVAGHDKVVTVP